MSHESALHLEKAFWMTDPAISPADLVAEGHTLFDGSVAWPALCLREPALAANIATMAAYVERHGMLFAPHGKTTMIPELFHRQLDAGAWAITVATPQQAMVALRAGVPRILIAHEVLDESALRVLLAVRDELRASGQGTELLCFVDSPEGVRVANGAAAGSVGGESFPVLLDVGFVGGRTGVRTIAEAEELAHLIRSAPALELVGTACYEGGLSDVDAARDFLTFLREVTSALREAGLLPHRLRDGSTPIVSAGGSAYFDLVAAELAGSWADTHGVRILLRSGAYITHDDLDYARRTPFVRHPAEGELLPALELWAQVVSVPEPGLALVGLGKRDAPFDEGLPVPKRLRRADRAESSEPAAAAPVANPAPADSVAEADSIEHGGQVLRGVAETTRLNDQHAYVRFDDALGIRPGDLIGFGISHPCTAFDRWRFLPVLDAKDRILDILRTYF